MTNFFERHKRRSVLALLLLLLPRARTVIVVLLLMVMLGVLFLGSRSLGLSVPWLERLARRVASDPDAGGLGLARWGRVAKLLQGSGQERGFQGRWSGRGVMASYEQRSSSIAMVKGMSLYDKKAGDGSESGYGTMLPKAGRGTQGVPVPEDAKKMADGVPVSHDELLTGLAKNHQGAKRGNGRGNDESLEARKRALDRGRAVSGGEQTKFPGLKGGGAGSGVHLTAFSLGATGGSLSKASGAPTAATCSSQSCSRFNLAEAKALSCAAAPPGTSCGGPLNCAPGVCPTEFASFAGGAPFAGSRAGGLGILTTEGEPVPITPDAQAALQSEYANAARDQNCTAQVTQGNAAVSTAVQVYQACCQSVTTSHASCWQSCPAWPLNILFGCRTHCNTTSNAQSQACFDSFTSTYNQIAMAQNAACPGSSVSGGHVQNTSWGTQCQQY